MSGTERRRRWSDEAKLRILAEADEPGARIGEVARRHDVHPGQIRLWRRSFIRKDLPESMILEYPLKVRQRW
nr:transposase [Agrobacterium vitis]